MAQLSTAQIAKSVVADLRNWRYGQGKVVVALASASLFPEAVDTFGNTTVTTDVNRMEMTEALVHTLQQQVSQLVVCFAPEVPQILATAAEFLAAVALIVQGSLCIIIISSVSFILTI